MARTNPIAVVTRFTPTSLGVIRSLVPSAVKTVVVDRETSHWVAATQMADKLVIDGESTSLVEALLSWSDYWDERPTLFITNDKDLLEISQRRKELEPYYRIILPYHPTVELLLNKRLFSDYASKKGYCVPKTYSVGSLEDLESIARKINYPCVLKPYMKKTSKHFSSEGLLSAYESLQPSEMDAIAQEWIPGGDEELYFCFLYFDRNGDLKAQFSARKIRQWPLETGSTSFAESVAREDLIEMSVELFRDLGYVGYGSVEYKRDARDGSFKIMEPTVGRFNLQIALATACGINIPHLMYCDLAGRPLPASNSQRDGVKWLYEAWDYQAFSKLRQQNNLSWLRWVWSLRGPKTCVAWNIKDPRPSLRIVKNAIRGRLTAL